jgi:hypothetical protein
MLCRKSPRPGTLWPSFPCPVYVRQRFRCGERAFEQVCVRVGVSVLLRACVCVRACGRAGVRVRVTLAVQVAKHDEQE